MSVKVGIAAETRSPENAIAWQASHCFNNGAPATGRVVQAMLGLLTSGTAIGERMAHWPGLTAEHAMPLRLAGGFHNLHLTGADARLAPIYAGAVTDQAEVDAIVLAVALDHDAALLPWLDGPPQTNEAGRSAGLMAGLMWLAARLGPKLDLLEIGASAGANTMLDRFAFDLGGVRAGPADSPILIRPDWRGRPPTAGDVEILSIKGCDQAPIDLTDPAQALRLKSYCWPENHDRLERLARIVAMAHARKPDLAKADAADWVEARLAEPQAAGVARVLFHSIVWQYIPAAGQARIEAAMAAASARADADRPLAWLMLETNRQTFRHELRVRYWPGGDEDWHLLGSAHAHGAWVEWQAG